METGTHGYIGEVLMDHPTPLYMKCESYTSLDHGERHETAFRSINGTSHSWSHERWLSWM